ncbi:hypothetical protein H0K13_004862 [Salmonella enterica]|uniref:hypothetical protein n=1 Tax=Salmonella enterica TaxID=28901 RepID=UPI000708DDDA|nr:hypothetical protein [Salmonella enterica]EGF6411590.1 hypothetical protein [Salmonella enterica subsp. enterica serovar 6,8:d:-]EHT5516065.1 hypothetical protein [Salmonella enterica subsp. enterica serovar Sandiego]EIE2768906.1 hypothetical protein [Salmonella enterica subsp. enterica serovar Rubislaw]EKB3330069.1 hypothetical protein [Salmonella enterica subsp. enterica serovar Chandans]OIN40842.1 hypothetical protein AO411_2024320 [Salmonella enterica subsp. enterica serovar Sarajane]
MKTKRYSRRVEKLMLHALNEATRIGFIPVKPGLEGVIESEGTEITVGGKNTVINWGNSGNEDFRFNVWWDYTPERCRRYFRKGWLRDLTGTMPDVSASTRRTIVGVCASCYLCVLEGGSIQLSRYSEFIVEYIRNDTVHLLDDLPDVEPSGYSAPGWRKSDITNE